MSFWDHFTKPSDQLAALQLEDYKRKQAEQEALRSSGVNYLSGYMDPSGVGATPAIQQKNLLSAAVDRSMDTSPDGKQRRVTPGGSIFGYDEVPDNQLYAAAFPEQAAASAQARAFPKPLSKDDIAPIGEAGAINLRNGQRIEPAQKAAIFKPVNMQLPGTNKVVLARNQQQYDQYADAGYAQIGETVPGAPKPEKDESWDMMTPEEVAAKNLPAGGSYQKNSKGEVRVITQPKQDTPNATQMNAAYHARRLSTAFKTLGEIVPQDPDAVVTNVPGNNRASKWARSQNQNRVQSLLPEIGDALLTLGTGAAYTKEQFENQWTANLPAKGDDDQMLSDKFGRVEALYNQAKENAGPAGADLPPIDAIASIFKARAVAKQSAIAKAPTQKVVIQNGWRYDATTHRPLGPVLRR